MSMDLKLSSTEARSSKLLEIKPLKSKVAPMKNGQFSKTFAATHSFQYNKRFTISKPAIRQNSTDDKALFLMLEEKRKRTLDKINQSLRTTRCEPRNDPLFDNILPKHGSFSLGTTNSWSTSMVTCDVSVAHGTDSSSKYSHRNQFSHNRQFGSSCKIISRKYFYIAIKNCEALNDIFKSVPGGIYNQYKKKWKFPLCEHDELLSAIKRLRPTAHIIPIPSKVLQTFKQSKEMLVSKYDLSHMDQLLVKDLYKFQKEGLYFGIKHGGKILLADDMGLGKTIQAIAIANYFMEDWPLLVVSPSSMKYSWLESFHKHLPSLDPSEIYVINSSNDQISRHKVAIISYDLLSKFQTAIINRGFKSVIFDESHYLKNPEALRTRAAQAVIKDMKRVIMLSGTPALSRPVELYTQLSALRPQYFNSYEQYGMRYCKGGDFKGASNTTELKLLLEDLVMIRRLKSEVRQQLPSKCRQRIVLDPSLICKNESMFQWSKKLQRIKNVTEIKRDSTIMKYFCETGIAKVSAVCQYISELLHSRKKFLCFAHHQEVIKGICSYIEKKRIDFIMIDGAVSAKQRKYLCDHFQSSDKCKVAVLSITAANVGITLTAASLVVFAELFWNPGSLIQAEDRAHRIGQVNSVLVQYLIARDTADDYLWRLIQHKLKTLRKVGLSEDNFNSTDEIVMNDPSVLDDTLGDQELQEIKNSKEKCLATKGVVLDYKHNKDLSKKRIEELPDIIKIEDKDFRWKRAKKELPEIIELDGEDLPRYNVKEELHEIIELDGEDLPRKSVKEELPEIIELED